MTPNDEMVTLVLVLMRDGGITLTHTFDESVEDGIKPVLLLGLLSGAYVTFEKKKEPQP